MVVYSDIVRSPHPKPDEDVSRRPQLPLKGDKDEQGEGVGLQTPGKTQGEEHSRSMTLVEGSQRWKDRNEVIIIH